MKIGSFFLILLAALVALGFVFSDSLHLREEMNNKQEQIDQLTRALQNSELQKQEAVKAQQAADQRAQTAAANLQTARQELQVCRQQVDQSNQVLARLNEQIANQTNVSAQPLPPAIQSTVLTPLTFLALGVGVALVVGLKSQQKHSALNRYNAKPGKYIYVTDAELKDLIQRRRNPTKSSTLQS